tara:strand:+ start:2375 stop:3379 length:1005 start_codon:yes stop_codon:yes gene_type:complete
MGYGENMSDIPRIGTGLDKSVLKDVISENYINFAPEYMSFLGEWITGTYKAFNDADKYTILVYLFKKNVTFYYDNFIKISYEAFYRNDHIDIEKINIVEIAKALGIPKETTRRKVSELEKIGVIKKKGKHLIIDKTAFKLVEPINTMKNLTNVFYLIYKICKKKKIINHDIEKENITNAMKANLTYTWYHYYKFIFTWLFNWKKFFNNDTEKFIIWCIPMLHRANKMKSDSGTHLPDLSSWRIDIEKIQTQGINTMSLSDITGIPRPTVTRKLKSLIYHNHLTMDKQKLIHPGNQGSHKGEMIRIHDNALNEFSSFTTKIFNQIILKNFFEVSK